MSKVYYSAAVKINDCVQPVIGVAMNATDGFSYEEARKNYEFIIDRYFGEGKKIIAFGLITEHDYIVNTNIQISDFDL